LRHGHHTSGRHRVCGRAQDAEGVRHVWHPLRQRLPHRGVRIQPALRRGSLTGSLILRVSATVLAPSQPASAAYCALCESPLLRHGGNVLFMPNRKKALSVCVVVTASAFFICQLWFLAGKYQCYTSLISHIIYRDPALHLELAVILSCGRCSFYEESRAGGAAKLQYNPHATHSERLLLHTTLS